MYSYLDNSEFLKRYPTTDDLLNCNTGKTLVIHTCLYISRVQAFIVSSYMLLIVLQCNVVNLQLQLQQAIAGLNLVNI